MDIAMLSAMKAVEKAMKVEPVAALTVQERASL
jgi:hypothetical protein